MARLPLFAWAISGNRPWPGFRGSSRRCPERRSLRIVEATGTAVRDNGGYL